MELVQNERRLYPQGGLAAHVIGYVGEVSEQELNTAEFAKYSQGDIVGKAGLERQYNDQLMGVDGQRRVVVDSQGREREVLESTEATPGQQSAADARSGSAGRGGTGDGRKTRRGGGARSAQRRSAGDGEPSAFDPNAFATHITNEYWKELTSNGDNPMLNRAIQAQFAPGSTFKPIVSMAALETNTIEENFAVRCNGGETFYGHYFHCDLKTGHGLLDLHQAIVHSCDVYFYTVGNKLGIDKIAEYADLVGIGKKTGIDLPGEAEGLMPSAKWKLRTQREKWYAGETISVAIGQGAVTVTPIQLASAIGGMVSGGAWYKPHLVKTTTVAEPRHAEFRPRISRPSFRECAAL